MNFNQRLLKKRIPILWSLTSAMSSDKNKDSPGILVIDISMTHYLDKLKNNTAYYVCSNKRNTGCSVTAVVTKIGIEDIKSGELSYRYILSNSTYIT